MTKSLTMWNKNCFLESNDNTWTVGIGSVHKAQSRGLWLNYLCLCNEISTASLKIGLAWCSVPTQLLRAAWTRPCSKKYCMNKKISVQAVWNVGQGWGGHNFNPKCCQNWNKVKLNITYKKRNETKQSRTTTKRKTNFKALQKFCKFLRIFDISKIF